MNYFGTSLDSAGHFFWTLHDDHMAYEGLDFKSVPFNPEEMPRQEKDQKYSYRRGYVAFYNENGYSIIAIEGSCKDKRGGSKSVFFVKEDLTQAEMKEKILSIPIAKKIIDKMPFEVKW